MKKSFLFLALLLAFVGMAMTGCGCCDDGCGDSCNTCDTGCSTPCSPCGDTSYSGSMPPPPPPPATR
jgi:hypothetical protein